MNQEDVYIPKIEKASFTETIYNYGQLIRIRQWTKNVFVFSGLLFPINTLDLKLILRLIFAFILFCGISSSVYIFNDIIDLKKDILHPVKRFRPLAAGKIKVKHALVLLYILCPCVILLSFMLDEYFGIVISLYLLFNLSYSLKLKEFVFIDLFMISLGFVLRALSGILVVGGNACIWFLLSIAFLSLYLGMIKRKKELITLSGESKKHRKNLGEYSIELINEINPMLMACTVITYTFHILYEVKVKFIFTTIPVVIYGILRYQYLTGKAEFGESPELVLLKDKPIVFTILLWGLLYLSSKMLSNGFSLL